MSKRTEPSGTSYIVSSLSISWLITQITTIRAQITHLDNYKLRLVRHGQSFWPERPASRLFGGKKCFGNPEPWTRPVSISSDNITEIGRSAPHGTSISASGLKKRCIARFPKV